jgi:tetratricopeptide (TPR) repeat protein
LSPSLNLIVGLTLTALLLSGCRELQGPTEFAAGKDALREGSVAEARADFEQAARLMNDDPGLLQQVALEFRQAGKPAEALPWVERAVKKSPTFDLKALLAQVHFETGQKDKGCSEYEALATSVKNNGELLNNYAYQCMAVPGKDLDRAIPLLQRAAELTEGNGAVVDSLGWAYVQRYRENHNLEDLRLGTIALEKAVHTTGVGSIGFIGGGDSESPPDEILDHVREHLIAAYAAAPTPAILTKGLQSSGLLQDCLGTALIQKSKAPEPPAVERAVEMIEAAVDTRPHDALARLHLGQAYLKRATLKDQTTLQKSQCRMDARVAFQKANWLNPQLLEAQTALYQLQRESKVTE